MLDPRALDAAAELINQADGVLIAAGAGMGVDSGLPDFRGRDGFWTAYPALAQAGLDFTQVASPRTFASDPALAWGFYGHRLALYRKTRPHAGFAILKRWVKRLPQGGFVFTSNVDGQFQRAGFAESIINECHGSIHWLQCSRPCSRDLWSADALQPDVDEAACRWRGELPACPRCGGLARPNILMFGDDAWLDSRAQQQQARLEAWLRRVKRPVVIEVGAGTYIATVRHLSQQVVRDFGGRLVRINPQEAEVPSPRDVGLAVGALEGLSALSKRLARG